MPLADLVSAVALLAPVPVHLPVSALARASRLQAARHGPGPQHRRHAPRRARGDRLVIGVHTCHFTLILSIII